MWGQWRGIESLENENRVRKEVFKGRWARGEDGENGKCGYKKKTGFKRCGRRTWLYLEK